MDRDWVVVGANNNTMLEQGFKQVGKDFPVFLHPETREEYALARQERKVAAGYKGFEFRASSQVSLKDDLMRRDLTINAMAKDEEGNLIDPFGGQYDLNNRLLRHVSEAFCEDPVRILRVARFAARFYHLGFKVAPETRSLMYKMVKSGEVKHLVAERVWKEFQRSLSERHPGQFIQVLRDCGALKFILPEIDDLFGVPNPPQHHPEIDSGIHTLMVLNCACQITKQEDVRFAALLHDLGKACSPMSQWPSHRGHDKEGVEVVKQFCRRMRVPKAYEDLACKGSEYHILMHKFHELTPRKKVTILERLNAFRDLDAFQKLLQVCEADSRGRLGFSDVKYDRVDSWLQLLAGLASISVKDILADGYEGGQIKIQLHQRRVARAKQLLSREE